MAPKLDYFAKRDENSPPSGAMKLAVASIAASAAFAGFVGLLSTGAKPPMWIVLFCLYALPAAGLGLAWKAATVRSASSHQTIIRLALVFGISAVCLSLLVVIPW
jgi:hypothetical protein